MASVPDLLKLVAPVRAASSLDDARARIRELIGALCATEKITVSDKGPLLFPIQGDVTFSVQTDTPPPADILEALIALAADAFRSVREKIERLQLDTMLDSIPLGVMSVDERGTILAANANTELLFGVQRFDLLEEPIGEAIPGDLGAKLQGLFESVRRDGRVHDEEIQHRAGGAEIHLGVSANPVGESGGVVFVCRDLMLSREIQKLRELDSMKTEFVHTVSHELKTPLTAIMGSLELLKMDKDTMDPQHFKMVGLVEQGAKRLQALVFHILNLSRLERGGVELEITGVDLRKKALEFRGRLPEPQAERVVILGSEEDSVPAAGDEMKMTEVVENLISNALKYSPDDKKVDVSVSVVEGMVHAEVKDRGIGIREEDQKNIFTKFYRTADARAMGKEGTGLGLSITFEIVKLHGGTLSFKSRHAEGTTFILDLPIWKG